MEDDYSTLAPAATTAPHGCIMHASPGRPAADGDHPEEAGAAADGDADDQGESASSASSNVLRAIDMVEEVVTVTLPAQQRALEHMFGTAHIVLSVLQEVSDRQQQQADGRKYKSSSASPATEVKTTKVSSNDADPGHQLLGPRPRPAHMQDILTWWNQVHAYRRSGTGYEEQGPEEGAHGQLLPQEGLDTHVHVHADVDGGAAVEVRPSPPACAGTTKSVSSCGTQTDTDTGTAIASSFNVCGSPDLAKQQQQQQQQDEGSPGPVADLAELVGHFFRARERSLPLPGPLDLTPDTSHSSHGNGPTSHSQLINYSFPDPADLVPVHTSPPLRHMHPRYRRMVSRGTATGAARSRTGSEEAVAMEELEEVEEVEEQPTVDKQQTPSPAKSAGTPSPAKSTPSPAGSRKKLLKAHPASVVGSGSGGDKENARPESSAAVGVAVAGSGSSSNNLRSEARAGAEVDVAKMARLGAFLHKQRSDWWSSLAAQEGDPEGWSQGAVEDMLRRDFPAGYIPRRNVHDLPRRY